MEQKQNLHVHSTYCDGADSPEEMIQAAMKKGFDSLGFSGHSYMHYSPSHSMSLEGTEQYKAEIRQLKEIYRGQIAVFCGLEMDAFSKIDQSGYDYMIGSFHYFKIGENYVGFDRDANTVAQVIDEWFGGDGMKYAKEYYRNLAELPRYGKFDIVGHFDLITKHMEKREFFNVESKEYRCAMIEAAEALAGKIPYFEVNTGAIARGYRTSPYPTVELLKELKRLGFGAVISSDCHNKTDLDCFYEEAEEMLKACGFRERYILTDDGFRAVKMK